MNKEDKILRVFMVLGVVFLAILAVSIATNSSEKQHKPAQAPVAVQSAEPTSSPDPKPPSTATLVSQALDNLGEETKNELASTSPTGYRGSIASVEPALGMGNVKVKVTTYFKDSGDSVNGGKNIAHNIFSMVCLDVPDLNSLYVVSGSGLESKSVYRSDIPACK